MEEKILEFINVLRRNGARISTAEHLDALEACTIASLGSKETFKDALRTALIKSHLDIRQFNEIFELYFSGLGDLVKENTQLAMSAANLSPEEMAELLEKIKEMLANASKMQGEMAGDMSGRLSPLSIFILTNDSPKLEQMIQEAAGAADVNNIENFLQEGYYSRMLMQMMNVEGTRRELSDLMEQLKGGGGMTQEEWEKLDRYLKARLENLPQLLREFVRRTREKNNLDAMEKFKEKSLIERNFNYLTVEEMQRMQEVVQKLANKLRTTISIRRKKQNRGRLDVSRTMRKNMKTGGIPMELVLQKKKKNKPQVMILCDISDSVRNVSRFMLQFMYSVQEIFSKVRSFVFVSDLGEATGLFEEHDVNTAIENAYMGQVVNVYSHSNFGRAFRIFHQKFLAGVNNKTTVIIIGDGRNNYNEASEWVLRDIRQKAKKVIWLNPEAVSSWGLGDSEMRVYAPYCDMTREVRNLRQLTEAIEHIVL